MPSRLIAVRFEVERPELDGAFWAALLGREMVEEASGVLVPGTASQVGLRFVAGRTPRRTWNRLHLHLTSATDDDQRRTVDTVLALGGQRRGSGPLPFGRDIYMTDPGGDELCVIEARNTFLEGSGPLGEVTCEGTATAGRFWAAALGWETVWDQDGQIAIQSPAGGTKLSWDGQPDAEDPGWNRQRFDLAAADPGAELERLVGLGATLVSARGDDLVAVDPDGSEFTVGPEAA